MSKTNNAVNGQNEVSSMRAIKNEMMRNYLTTKQQLDQVKLWFFYIIFI